jgi:hypothetical protein
MMDIHSKIGKQTSTLSLFGELDKPSFTLWEIGQAIFQSLGNWEIGQAIHSNELRQAERLLAASVAHPRNETPSSTGVPRQPEAG